MKMAKIFGPESIHDKSTIVSESSQTSLQIVTVQINGDEIPASNLVESWLPITGSRNGSVYTATFHLLCSGIGFQVLLLPAAFAAIGWAWGILCLSIGFAWQLYTTWILVHLHEPVPGTRHSRYIRLLIAAFGEKLGKLLGIFPVMYLSGGACSLLIMTGGATMKQLHNIMSENDSASSPSTTIWFLIFTCIAVVMVQFPNLNSLAGISLVGGVTGLAYCNLIWVVPVANGRPQGVSYDTPETNFGGVFYAVGFVALSFRGHNLVLEIQGTLPSNSKSPSSKPMWRAVTISYVLIAMCMFPLSVAAYWAYGSKIPTGGGPTGSYLKFYGQNYSKLETCFIHLTFVIGCLCSYPLLAMPSLDNLAFLYISKKQKPCSLWIRTTLRLFFGGLTFFVSVALPFLPNLAVLVGGIALPLTFPYPCFIWVLIKKPPRFSPMWCLNYGLGCLGLVLSVLLVIGGAWHLADNGLHANFFKPR